MSISLKSIVMNRPQPPRICIYGPEGIGKTTLVSQARKPVFILAGREDGLGDIVVPKFPVCKTFDEVVECLDILGEEEHDYETVIIDTLDALEPLVWAETCSRHDVDSIEEVLKGFGKGYVEALQEWMIILDRLTALRDYKKMTVIIVAHSQYRTVRDPEHPEYDTNTLKLQKAAASMITEWSDVVVFASLKTYTKVDETVGRGKEKERRAVALPSQKRILRMSPNAAFVAKHRYSNMPDEMLFLKDGTWDEFVKYLPGGEKALLTPLFPT